ncbi:MAG: GTPase HflX [Bacteroidota bacterium]|jgi:GTPase|nr:GTPase HflX [Sphingobacteriia bacterium]
MAKVSLIPETILKSCVLVGVMTRHQTELKTQEYLQELEFLALTYGLKTQHTITQRLDVPDTSYFIGKGKLDELKHYVDENSIEVIVFDDELSPSQQRNIEKAIPKKILDRTSLILEIFEQRAHTAYAKTQVELARLQYLLPRLTGMWTHLERQRGGTGTRGGAGEKEIETDRRIVRNKIALLKKRLGDIDRQMVTQRKHRGEMVRVALVGYTNVGKSTIMNVLSKSQVFAENKLFATLDTTVRKVHMNALFFLLSDTVGFIRKLPTTLVESFKSTLDEVRESDLLVHVIDISNPAFEDQIKVVQSILSEIGAAQKDHILVFNKIDLYFKNQPAIDDLTNISKLPQDLNTLRASWKAQYQPCLDVLFISATEKTQLDVLRNTLYEHILRIQGQKYPYLLHHYG